jgi:chemotaxis protein CheC
VGRVRSLSEVLSDYQYEALTDVAKRGVANSATGLSEMVGRTIDMRALDVSLLGLDQVPKLLGAPDDTVVGIYLAIWGDIVGHILLLFSPTEANGLVDMLMEQPWGTTTSLGSMERSALGEVGNLTGSFFLNALAEMTALGGQPSPPAVMVDMGAAILDVPLVALAESSDEVLVIRTSFVADERQIGAVFLVMPDARSLLAILNSLGRNGG